MPTATVLWSQGFLPYPVGGNLGSLGALSTWADVEVSMYFEGRYINLSPSVL